MKYYEWGENHFYSLTCVTFRSTYFQVFFKIGVLKNFSKFTGKAPASEFLFTKVAGSGMRLATLLKETLEQAFSYEFCEISKYNFFHRTLLVAASEHLTQCRQSGDERTLLEVSKEQENPSAKFRNL